MLDFVLLINKNELEKPVHNKIINAFLLSAITPSPRSVSANKYMPRRVCCEAEVQLKQSVFWDKLVTKWNKMS